MLSSFTALIGSWPLGWRLLVFVGLALATHLLVLLIRRLAGLIGGHAAITRLSNLRTVGTLLTSIVVFTLYFVTFGFVLQELGVPLKAYLASASVVGLAVGFGSQGVVQDVVTGLTFIFTNLVDVGDLVEVSGQTGRVRAITMRFVELENALGASVFIPNRTIGNVINYPKGYVRCLVDVTLTGEAGDKDSMAQLCEQQMRAFSEQYPGILLTAPSIEGRFSLVSGKDYVRIKFRIWPNRGQPIETSFARELGARLRELDAGYQDWMIAVSYEAEARAVQRRKLW